jgi:hypothetical protein
MPLKGSVWFGLGILFLLSGPQAAMTAPSDRPAFSPLPQHLSKTGLYVKGSTTEIRPELVSFSPQYPLWSDGATKRRWIELPLGSFIDASDPDAWEFPCGTRLWKEFSVGRPVETRFIERLADGSWRFAAYVWNEDGTDAVLAPAETGVTLPPNDTRARRYIVPSEYDCRACHEGAPVPVLGFSALQLSPARDPLAPHAEQPKPNMADLRELAARGLVRNLPQQLIDQPPRVAASSPTERAALGYLHANCSHCHSVPTETGASVPVDTIFQQKAADPSSASHVLRSLIEIPGRYRVAGADRLLRIVTPGDAHASVLPLRMRSRDPRVQMPPLGTSIPDTEAIALIERWINELKQEATHE